MTALEIARRVLELDAQATTGPWETDGNYDLYVFQKPRGGGRMVADRNVEHDPDAPEGSVVRARGVGAGRTDDEMAANMRLVAAYRDDAPVLAREVERLTRERDDLAAQLADKRKAVRVSKQAVESGLRTGTRVLYAPVLGGKEYAGVVASKPRIVGGTEVVKLEEMEPAYGKDTGTHRTTVTAAAVDHLFIEDGE